MLKSMTGFGIAEYKDDHFTLRVEIRSVNNKFLKIDTRLPEILQSYESEIERPIRKKVVRGSIHVNVNYKPLKQDAEYVICHDRLREYYELLNNIKNEIGSNEDISVNSLLVLPGVLQREKNNQEGVDILLSRCVSLIHEALEKLIEMRISEGSHLEKDIVDRKDFLLSILDNFEARAPIIVQDYSKRLKGRVKQLLDGTDIELTDNNLCREVAIFAERCDITEEIHRLKGHLYQLQESISLVTPVGRKLDFIVQEMFRETNTMCAKANDSELLKDLINIKTEIEKIREQIFNVE